MKDLLKKIFKNIILTLLIVAVILGVFIAINWYVEELALDDIDFTEEKIYSLSDESKIKVQDISKDVTIYFFGLSSYETTIDLARQFTTVNEHIKIEDISNITDRPDLATKYGIETDSQVIVVESGDRTKILSTYDLSTYDDQTWEEIDLTEQALINAILDVTIENKPKVYFLDGHNTYNLEQYMYTIWVYLENEANETEKLDILKTNKVPEDASALVITELKEDITEVERDRILEYVARGGNILVMQGANFHETTFPNFQSILDTYGVSISNGVIFEQDANKMLYNAPYIIIPTADTYSDITKYIATSGSVGLINSAKLNIAEQEKLDELNVTVNSLLISSEEAFERTDLSITSSHITEKDEESPSSILGALFEKTLEGGEKSNLVVYANCQFATDKVFAYSNDGYPMYSVDLYNNKELVLNTIAYLTEREDLMVVRKATATTYTFNATAMEIRVIQTIIIALPILVILVGIIVWRKRIRRK